MTAQDDRAGAAPSVAGPQSEAAVAPAATSPMPTVLSDEQRQLLAAVLDTIVPPNGALPGAGGLGVDASIDRTLALTPALRRLFLDGLAEIEVASERQMGQDFGVLDAATRERVLRAVEETSPAFFSALVAHAYRGYYTLPEVQLAVGFTDRAPQPDGYVLPVFREELLKVQLKREPFWRKAE
ncbi:MAG: gluconate 2-dehydrogenase subunit 3 family protein [Chloroflexota bacterium]